jgi:undecaprenyl-diphosphatase
MSYLQAIVLGILQGITELFPISSLGHGVIVPALLGWHNLVGSETKSESFYLAFLVGLHVGTAVALLLYYRKTWGKVIGGFFTSIQDRSIKKPYQRLAWLLIVGTIPVGIVGLAFEHKLRVLFTKPLAASIFLVINGVILLIGEFVRRRAKTAGDLRAAHRGRHAPGANVATDGDVVRHISSLSLGRGVIVGSSQILALFAGISRSGVTMVTGIFQGLDEEDAAQYTFLLATPVILLAGLYKIPDLLGPNGNGIRGQAFVGAIAAGVAAFLSVKFLVRWFQSHTLWPFAIYSLVVGGICVAYFA